MKDDSLRDRILRFEATEEEVVAWYLRGVLERTRGNQSEAMRVLAIDRSTVRRRIGRLGIAPPCAKRPGARAHADRDAHADIDAHAHEEASDLESLEPDPDSTH